MTPPAGKKVFRWQYETTGPNAVHLDKGAELGRFKLGSTIVACFAPDAIDFLNENQPGKVTRMGELFGHFHTANEATQQQDNSQEENPQKLSKSQDSNAATVESETAPDEEKKE